MSVEICAGCGKPTRGYEFYGVGLNDAGTEYIPYPVCRTCHHEPPASLPKMHFFHETQLERGVRAAEASRRAQAGATQQIGKG